MPEDIIREKLASLHTLLSKLDEMLRQYAIAKNLDHEAYLFAAEKKAEEAVELATRINGEILLEYFQHTCKDYFSSFMDLGKLEIFEPDFLAKLAQTAGFRNRLIHDYLGLSESITTASMRHMLDIYPRYINGILKFLENRTV